MRTILLRKILKYCATNTDSTDRMRAVTKIVEQIIPSFRQSSDCLLMIMASIHFILSLQPKNNLHKKKPKVRTSISNEGKYVKVKR